MSEHECDQIDEIVEYVAGFGKGMVDQSIAIENLDDMISTEFASARDQIGELKVMVDRSGICLRDDVTKELEHLSSLVDDSGRKLSARIGEIESRLLDYATKAWGEVSEETASALVLLHEELSSRASDITSDIDKSNAHLSQAVNDSQAHVERAIKSEVNALRSEVSDELRTLHGAVFAASAASHSELREQTDLLNRNVDVASRNLNKELAQFGKDMTALFRNITYEHKQLCSDNYHLELLMEKRIWSVFKWVRWLLIVCILMGGSILYLLLRGS
jgi:gas vesicle protein